jgi:hypothetical protein
LIGDVESAIETGPEILPRNHGSQLDELFVAELLPQMIDLFVGRGRRSATQCGRVVEYVLLEITECVALPMIAEFQQLIFRDALFSADGGVGIQSEQTPDHGGGLQAGEYLDLLLDALRAIEAGLKRAGGPEHATALRHHAEGFGNGAELLAGHAKDIALDESRFVVLQAFDSRHRLSLTWVLVSGRCLRVLSQVVSC